MEFEPKLTLHIKNQEQNKRRTGAEEEWKKNRAGKFTPRCQNPDCAKIGIGANFGIGFWRWCQLALVPILALDFGIGANFGTLPTSCVRNPLSPSLLTFLFSFLLFFLFYLLCLMLFEGIMVFYPKKNSI